MPLYIEDGETRMIGRTNGSRLARIYAQTRAAAPCSSCKILMPSVQHAPLCRPCFQIVTLTVQRHLAAEQHRLAYWNRG